MSVAVLNNLRRMTSEAAAKAAAERAEAWRDLRSILERAEAPDVGDPARLGELMKLLKLADADIERLVAVLGKYKRLAEQAATAAEHVAAIAKIDAEAQPLNAQIVALQRQASEISNRRVGHVDARQNAIQADQAARKLALEHPELLAQEAAERRAADLTSDARTKADVAGRARTALLAAEADAAGAQADLERADGVADFTVVDELRAALAAKQKRAAECRYSLSVAEALAEQAGKMAAAASREAQRA